MNKNNELVLVVPSGVIFKKGRWQGLKSDNLDYYLDLIKNNYQFKRRGDVEDDPSFQQIIPHIVFSCGNRFFVYKYLPRAGEQRLVDTYQLGFGGHINDVDVIRPNSERMKTNDKQISNDKQITNGEKIINETRIVLADESYNLMGLLFEIHNKLGPIYKEKNYQDAIEEILKREKIPYEREKNIPLEFENLKVSNFFADFIIDGKIVLEVKASQFITQDDIRQTLRYIKSANIPLGIITNFRKDKLEYKRLVNPSFDVARPNNERIETNSERIFDKNSLSFDNNSGDIVEVGMMREWEEEVDYKGNLLEKKLVGILNDDSRPVEQVHLGLVYHFVGDSPEISIRETEKMQGELVDIKDIGEKIKNNDGVWVKIVYNEYLKNLK